MAQKHPRRQNDDVFDLLGRVVHDIERLVDQHLELARGEFRRGLRDVPPAVASVAAGAGLVATGGVLGSLMLVHGLHRSTRVPLWGCYGLVGGLMAAAGAGLLREGARRAAEIDLAPRETFAAIREDVQWIKDQTSRPPDFELEADPPDPLRDLREAIAETRGRLSEHLDALRTRLFHPDQVESPQPEATMPTKKASRRPASPDASQSDETKTAPKAPKRKASSEAKTAAPKKASSAKSQTSSASASRTSNRAPASKKGTAPKKSAPRRKASQGLVEKTEEVLDTVLAGAVVGAVTGAARTLTDEPSAVPPASGASRAAKSSRKPTTGEVLGEMASGAALGAVAGAAKAVLPKSPPKGPPKKKSK